MGEAWERRRDDPEAQWNQPRKAKARKDTRRWCRGVPGREHVPLTVVPPNAYRPCRETGWWDRETRTWHKGGRWACEHVVLCQLCQKVLERYVPECPDKPAGLPQLRSWWQATT